jgi:phenylacetate-coenzyme A ligase PaaK-like adenylate-forming protein
MARVENAAPDLGRTPFEWWDSFSRASEIWWTRNAGRSAIETRGADRCANLVEFARQSSRYYRDAYAALPQRSLLLAELPAVSKRDLMLRFDDWVTDARIGRAGIDAFLSDRTRIGQRYLDQYLVWKSSGSTGEPGIFVQDDAALRTYDALMTVQLQGAQVAGRYTWGLLAHGGRAALIAATGDHFASIASWQRVCRGSPWPSARAFSVMDPLPKLVAEINDYQPAFLASYPTTLTMLAAEQRAGRLAVTPACMWSGGEFLAPAARTAIESAFGCPLVNEYGASECMSIAYSCREGWLHVNADWVTLEPVDRDHRRVAPGVASHTALLTNLANRVQPLIRYDLGDSILEKPDACACGSALPAIHVHGRRDDILGLQAPDGSTVQLSPLALTTVVEEAARVHRFQIVQTGPDQLALRFDAADAGERAEQWGAIETALRAYLTLQSLSNVRIRLDSQAPVPDARSGKLRQVIVEFC